MLHDRQNSLYVGNLGPIPLYLHWSFLILVWLAFRRSSPGGFELEPVLILLTVLLSGIVLHELGHALAARALGAMGITITLWAMGGVCHSTRDRLPRREILILAAGPLVSVLLAAVGILAIKALAVSHPGLLIANPDAAEQVTRLGADNVFRLVYAVHAYGTLLGRFLAMMWLVNSMLALFNIMPIYPLDGGQIVFNAMSLVMPLRRAAGISLAVAVAAAGAYFIYDAQGRSEPNTYLMVMLGLLLYNAWNGLR